MYSKSLWADQHKAGMCTMHACNGGVCSVEHSRAAKHGMLMRLSLYLHVLVEHPALADRHLLQLRD